MVVGLLYLLFQMHFNVDMLMKDEPTAVFWRIFINIPHLKKPV
jgi:hypothetical protein